MKNEKQLTHVDLFSGIGGFSLASEWAGFRTIAFCEKDEWCQSILRQHWPDTQIHGDIRAFPGDLYRGATLVTGGIPCQPFAQCGKLKGKKDDRYLWPAMFETIKTVRPSWVVLENVPNIIKMALPSIISDLESARFQCAVFLLPAHGIGAPHRRRRAYVVAESLDPNPNSIRPYREEVHSHGQEQETQLRHEQGGIPRSMVPEQIWKTIDPRVFGVADGIPNRLDKEERRKRIQAVGNAVVPQLIYEILAPIAAIEYNVNHDCKSK
jgi:DNA (cytosine-5)-methyltransferase 1